MHQDLQLFDNALWGVIALSLWILVFELIRRGATKSFPRWTALVGFQAAEMTLMLPVAHLSSYSAYFWAFYACTAGETLLHLLVLHEIFLKTFAPLHTLPASTIPRLWTILAAVATVTLAWAMWNPAFHPNFPWFADLLSTLNRSAGIVVAASLWTVVMHARRLHLPWQSRTAGISRGFLLYLSVQAVTTAATGFAGEAWTMWFNRIGSLAYLAALGFWLHAVRQEDIAGELPTPKEMLLLQGIVEDMRSATARIEAAAGAHNGVKE